jgi:hypothetical protein
MHHQNIIVTCEFSRDEAELLELCFGRLGLWHLKSRIEDAKLDAIEDNMAAGWPEAQKPTRYLCSTS